MLKQRKKTPARWKWLGGIVTAAAGTALAAYFTPGAAVWSAIGRAFAWTLRVLAAPITLPTWAVLLGGLVILVVIGLGMLLALAATAKPARPDYADFTEAVILGVKWTWRWSGNRIEGDSVSPLCPRCDYDLRPIPSNYNWNDAALKCDHCGEEWFFEFRMSGLLDRVLREINRRLRKGEWPGAQQETA